MLAWSRMEPLTRIQNSAHKYNITHHMTTRAWSLPVGTLLWVFGSLSVGFILSMIFEFNEHVMTRPCTWDRAFIVTWLVPSCCLTTVQLFFTPPPNTAVTLNTSPELYSIRKLPPVPSNGPVIFSRLARVNQYTCTTSQYPVTRHLPVPARSFRYLEPHIPALRSMKIPALKTSVR